MKLKEAIKTGKPFRVKGEDSSCIRYVDTISGYILYRSDDSQVPLSLIHFEDKIEWETIESIIN